MSALALRFWSKVAIGDGCWEWLASIKATGYGSFGRLNGASYLAHRVAWFLTYNEWPKLCVLHRCDNRRCVRPSHLFLGTRSDNAADRDAKGRTASGDRVGCRLYPERYARGVQSVRAKLTREQVLAIRAARGVVSQTELARQFNVGQETISRVQRRERYGDIQ